MPKNLVVLFAYIIAVFICTVYGSVTPRLLSVEREVVRHFMNPRNCTEFYRCASVERLECPEGRLFSYDLQDCLNIGLISAETPSETEAATRPRRSMNHRFIDPKNAHTFYNCLDTPVSFECPENTVFNEDSEVCDWKGNVPRCAH